VALPLEHPQRLEIEGLWRDSKALEALLSGAHNLLSGNAAAVTLQPKPQP
jgi:hypothetical protein